MGFRREKQYLICVRHACRCVETGIKGIVFGDKESQQGLLERTFTAPRHKGGVKGWWQWRWGI